MKNTILIVDDVEINRDLLKNILEDVYEIQEADNGKSALQILTENENRIDAVLLDIHMPEMNGFDVLEHMRQSNWLNKIPVLVISMERSTDIENKCFEIGVSDFIHKPFEPSKVRSRVKNIVELFGYKNALEDKVEKQTEALKMQYQVLQMQASKLRESNEKILEVLGTVVEYRNLEDGQHIRYVKRFTEILAKEVMRRYPEYGLDDNKIKQIVATSVLHDMGKISIPDSILLKPGKLTEEEYEYMKSHTTRGCEMLELIRENWAEEYRQTSYEVCRYHHERYDGNGYPDGLKGDEIPISAQIVSVADVYDALISERVYKNAYSKEEAFHMIINGECGVFSPKIMECFRLLKDEFERLVDEGDRNRES